MKTPLLVAIIAWFGTSGIVAQNLTVTSSSGNWSASPLSLRTALEQVGAGDTIKFDPSLYGRTIDISGIGALNIPPFKTLVIDADTLNISINAGSFSQVLTMGFGGNVYDLTLIGLQLEYGYHSNNGGALALPSNSSLTLYNCRLHNCYSEKSGGAIMLYSGCTFEAYNCVFSNNRSDIKGGGLTNFESNVHLEGCLFYGNSASTFGAAVGTQSNHVDKPTSSTFINCTVTGNTVPGTSDSNGKYMISEFISGTYSNCLFYDNTYRDSSSKAILNSNVSTITNCAFFHYDSIVTNATAAISSLVDVSAIDTPFISKRYFALNEHATSLIDAGDNSVNLQITGDLSGGPRLYDGGAGSPLIDIGAYEFSPVSVIEPGEDEDPIFQDLDHYYVDTTGNDGNEGTREAPFRTINMGISKINTGDTLTIFGGIYREHVHVNVSGLPGKRIVIEANGLENVEINGLEILEGEWILENAEKNIYKLSNVDISGMHPDFVENCFQVFVNRQPLVDARYPNCNPDEYFTRKGWATVDENSWFRKTIDRDLGTKFTKEDIEGALIQLNLIHQFFSWTRTVTDFNPSTGEMNYEMDSVVIGLKFFSDTWKNSWQDDYYYLLGKKVFLDYPGEYFFDSRTNDLYVIPPDGVDLNSSQVEMRARTHGMTGVGKHTDIKNLSFFGCGMHFKHPTEKLVIDGCAMRYPKYQRVISETQEDYPFPEGLISTGISGIDNTVTNTYMSHSFGAGFITNCSDNNTYSTVNNSIFHDASPSGSLTEKALSAFVNTGIMDFNELTVFNTGNVGLHLFGVKTKGGRFLCQYSEIYNSGMLSNDVTSVYCGNDYAYRGRITHNWIHDNHAEIGPNAVRADDEGLGLTVDHNVIWNIGNTPQSKHGIKGMALKGDQHAIFNNTLFDVREDDILIRQSYEGENQNTYAYNNLCMEITAKNYTDIPVVGIKGMEKNYIYTGEVPLQNAEKRDFYPLIEMQNELTGTELPTDVLVPVELDSEFPYIGAYGFDSEYWIPGAENGVRFEIDRIDEDTYHLSMRYILPLLSPDELSLEINGSMVGDTLDISVDASFAPVLFEVPATVLNPGENVIRFVSAQFPPAVDSSYTLTDAESRLQFEMVYPESQAKDLKTVQFKICEDRQGVITPSAKVTTQLGTFAKQTDSLGISMFLFEAGTAEFDLSKEGFASISGNLEILSDTMIVDTLIAHEYMVDFIIKDAETGELIPEGEIQFDGEKWKPFTQGQFSMDNILFGKYEIELYAEKYDTAVYESILIKSDTLLELHLSMDYLDVSVTVLDRSSGNPINRVRISYDDNLTGTNIAGKAMLDKILEGNHILVFDNDKYFTYTGNYHISSDTSLVIELTAKLASFTIEVRDESGPLADASVNTGGLVQFSDDQGSTLFFNQPARKDYKVEIEKKGYDLVIDTFFLEIDTTITYNLEETTSVSSTLAESIQLYPNPLKDKLMLIVPKERYTLMLVTMPGRVLSIQKIESPGIQTIDMTWLEPGIYLLKIATGKGMSTFKIIKE